MSSETAVRDAIERAYSAFAGVVRPVRLDASPLRDPNHLGMLISQPLRGLSGDVIGPYAGWAMTTVGAGSDYRYFLPRILELAVCGGGWGGTEPPVIAKKLQMAEWTTWSADERETVVAVFEAAFRWSLHRHIDFTDEAPWWLCGLVLLGQPVTPLLAEWRLAASVNANLQLAQFFNSADADLRRGRLCGAWWDDVPEAVSCEVAAWLSHPDTRAQLLKWQDRVLADDRWMFENALFYWS